MVVLLLLANSGTSFAADNNAPATDTNIYNYNITQTEFDEYNAAVSNCDTPSLECLVRYTTRFIAMEWVNDIQNGGTSMKGLNSTSSTGGGGLIGGVFSMIGGMYDYQPAKTSRYVADVMDSAGFATPAYAQGLGFASLDPILGLWKMFRNVAYFFFIVIFIIIGFMIMFRAKIGSQAVITAQQAIPSVIVSLVLVTFSYAIAGFMIDLMYLLMFLIVGLFNGLSGGAGEATVSSASIVNFNILTLTGFLFKNSVGSFGNSWSLSSKFLEAAGVSNDFFNTTLSFLGGLTLTVVITIAALIGCVRLFFELLKSYAAIVLAVVLGPLALMMGAFPGSNVFWPWLKSIIGNLLAFPVVMLLIIMFIEFTKDSASHTTTGGFMPPFLLGAGQVGMIGPLMGFAIILAMPEIVKKVKDATGAADGGFASMVAGAAWSRAKDAWSGNGFMGIKGRGLMTAGAVGASMLATVPAGAAISGLYSASQGGSMKEGAKRGALWGIATPFLARSAPSMVGGIFNTVKTQARDILAEDTVDKAVDYFKEKQGVAGEIARSEYIQRLKARRDQNKTQPAPRTNNVGQGSSGDSF